MSKDIITRNEDLMQQAEEQEAEYKASSSLLAAEAVEKPAPEGTASRAFDWPFWLQWVLVNTAGSTVGGVLVFVVSMFYGGAAGWFIAGAAGGVVAGTAQWRVLRQRVRLASWWVLASTVGWAVGLAAGWAVDQAVSDAATSSAAFLAVSQAVSAVVAGAGQWLVLRRRVRRAGWWVLARAVVGGGVGAAIYAATYTSMATFLERVSDTVANILAAMLASVLVSAAVTGAVLVWLLGQPRELEH